ncbi:C40 family peptidase [Natroniella acetigena]|uniref:C40 family peptidase n=1 Tax=Natroniella acetigena TaxID=52004 RepID=UPI00200B768D|nr:NlpC/P60 family protein [Natroniella acetigena]MCK8828281.1 C40 family peptidase [Natroniella acetigena]
MDRKRDKKIKEVVSKYRNIPYKHNGRSLRGLDCLGLIIFFYKEFGIDLTHKDRNYSKEWYKEDAGVYLRELLKVGTAVEFDNLQALDLVYFELLPDVVTHSGVMVNDQQFIHILQKRNVEISSFNRFWRKKFAGARRLI